MPSDARVRFCYLISLLFFRKFSLLLVPKLQHRQRNGSTSLRQRRPISEPFPFHWSRHAHCRHSYISTYYAAYLHASARREYTSRYLRGASLICNFTERTPGVFAGFPWEMTVPFGLHFWSVFITLIKENCANVREAITNSSPIQGNEAASACLEGIMFSCTTRTTIFPMYSCGQFRISPLFPLMSARRKTSLREETEGQARTMFYLHLHSYLSLEVESHNHIFEIARYRVAIYVACQNLIYSCAYSCPRLLAQYICFHKDLVEVVYIFKYPRTIVFFS